MGASRLLLVAVSVAAATALVGCSGGSGATSASGPANVPSGGSAAPAGGSAAAAGPEVAVGAPLAGAGIGPALARTGATTVEVPDRAAARRAAVAVATRLGGALTGETSDSGGSTLELTVGAARLDQALDEIAQLGRERERRVTSEDVSRNIADVGARTAAAADSLQRLRRLFDRAGSVTEVQRVEGALAAREGEFESLQAQARTLSDRTALDHLTVRLVTPPPPAVAAVGSRPSPARALAAGWHALRQTALVVLVALAAALPFLVVAALLLVAFVVLRRRGRRMA